MLINILKLHHNFVNLFRFFVLFAHKWKSEQTFNKLLCILARVIINACNTSTHISAFLGVSSNSRFRNLNTILRVLKGGSYSHFPARIFTKSHRPTAQIPLSQCLPCSNLSPIPIFYCFFVDESQSQSMKSHFPSQEMGKSQFPFYPFRSLYIKPL